METKPIETYTVHEYLRSKLCSLYENDCIFDKFECCWNGNDTASSGFFIVHKDAPHLDNSYSAFGNVISGIDTLDRIASMPCAGPNKSMPVRPVILEAAVVLPKKKQ